MSQGQDLALGPQHLVDAGRGRKLGTSSPRSSALRVAVLLLPTPPTSYRILPACGCCPSGTEPPLLSPRCKVGAGEARPCPRETHEKTVAATGEGLPWTHWMPLSGRAEDCGPQTGVPHKRLALGPATAHFAAPEPCQALCPHLAGHSSASTALRGTALGPAVPDPGHTHVGFPPPDPPTPPSLSWPSFLMLSPAHFCVTGGPFLD